MSNQRPASPRSQPFPPGVRRAAWLCTAGVLLGAAQSAVALTLGLPPPVTVEATANESATVTLAAATVGGAVGATTLNCPGVGASALYLLGTTTLSCHVTDSAGNAASATTSVTIVDTIAPVLTMFAPITTTATSAAGATVAVPPPVVTDTASVPTVTCNPPPGASLFTVGVTVVTCAARDGGGNVTSRTSTVTVLAPSGAGNHATWVITDLGTLPGFLSSAAFGVNNVGQVTGSTSTDTGVGSGNIHGFLWTPDRPNGLTGAFTDLGVATSGLANGMKINDYGQVAVNVGAPSEIAWLWTPTSANARSGAAVALLGTASPSDGFGLNNLGQVVGGGGPAGPFVWTPNVRNGTSGSINFTVAQGSNGPYDASGYNCHCTPAAINDGGQVAGSLFVGPYARPIIHANGAVSFPASNPYDFGTIGLADLVGPQLDSGLYEGSGAFESINAAGHAAGSRIYVDAQGNINALPVFWDGAAFHPIGTGLSAHGINNQDEVVGETWLTGLVGQSGGFLYSKGTLTELRTLVDPALGWQIDHARSINDAGQIVGDGLHNGVRHAYLLTPTSVDVSAQVTITRSGLRYDPTLHRWFQTVRLANAGPTTIAGPVSLVLTNLAAGIALATAGGTTSVVAPLGRPWMDAGVASLAPGASATLSLVFNDPANLPVSYATQVLAGPGQR